MKPDITPTQRRFICACFILPIMGTSTYHVMRIVVLTDWRWLLLLVIPAFLLWIGWRVIEKKYVLGLPTYSEVVISCIAVALVWVVNSLSTVAAHSPNGAYEVVDSATNLLCILPFMLFLKSKIDSLKVKH